MALRINEKDVLGKPDQAVEVELAKNYNRIEIIYASPKNGDATFRLYWSGEKFDFEPVPPDVLFSRGDEADLIEKSALREGRQLFASLNCVYCHQPVNSVSMPELRRNRVEAPRLDQFGDRFQPDWVAAWILNPRAVRPEATMPRVFHLVGDEKNASDIAAFLISQKREDLNALAKSPNAANGQAIYKKLGCGTCHRLDHPGAKDELDRLSLHFVGAKFAPHAIGHFLKEPHKRYPWTRMPDFKLSDDEAAHLEAFLRQNAKGTIDARPLGNAGTGKKLFSQSCSACHTDTPMEIHDVGGIKKLTIPIRSLDKGCLAAKDQGKGLDFGLNAHQRNALTAFVKTDGVSLTRETPAEFSQRQVRALQCNSCHRRDGDITRWHAVLEVEGKEPEKLPSMTWIGEKLKPAWTQKLLAGQHDHSARPWIKARMPAFPARAEMLAVGLSHEHGFGIDDDERPKPDAKLAAIGEKLVPQQGGFKCNDCHAIGKTPATQPFEVEARGINLLDAALRLRYSYYQRWMMVPDRVDVTMRMPVFSSDGKTTQLREVFDGDARKQYDALWHYIQTLPTR
jgi:mono/diheme cytochrome c family protein